MSKPAAKKYKTTHWKSYNEVLRRMGRLTVWVDGASDKWQNSPEFFAHL